MSPSTRVGLVQMTSGPDPAANLVVLEARLAALAAERVAMVLTPENVLVLGGPADTRPVAEVLGDGPLQAQAAALARRYGVWLSLGSFPVRADGGRSYATTLVYDDQGALRAHYEKLHLFDVSVAGDRGGADFAYRESDTYAPGDREVVVETPLGPLGLSICYDLRFPGLYQRLRRAGAEALAVPAAFTKVTGEAHWEALLRARAIETQCYVLAPAQVGHHPDGRDTWGQTLAVDPWGRVLASAAPDDPFVVVEVDRAEVTAVRSRMPVVDHARHPVGSPGTS